MNIIHLLLIIGALALVLVGTISWTVAFVAIAAVILFGNLILSTFGVSLEPLFSFPGTDLFGKNMVTQIVSAMDQKVRSGAAAVYTAGRASACACSN